MEAKRRAHLNVTEQFLSGARPSVWFRLLWENRFRIDRRYVPRALYVTLATFVTLPFALYERARFDRRVRATRIDKPPVFILGHWRSGTTYLHVLMAQDRNFAYASNVQAILPSLFLGSGKIFERSVRRFLPERRWMDNFALKPDLPSEDEFAVANLSPFSMYHSLPFPRNRDHYAAFCTLEGVPRQVIEQMKDVYLYYLKKLTYHAGGRRLLLKNPTNTARIGYLLEIFPDAKFVHIYRDPYQVYCSTVRMYEKMFPSFYLQEPDGDPREFILDMYARMYENYFQQQHLIPAGNLVEVRYEEFIREPLRELRRVYDGLSLAGFEEAKDAFVAYVQAQRDYQVNEHELSGLLKEQVTARWRTTIERWGYPTPRDPGGH